MSEKNGCDGLTAVLAMLKSISHPSIKMYKDGLNSHTNPMLKDMKRRFSTIWECFHVMLSFFLLSKYEFIDEF